MIIRLLDIVNGKVVPSEHCYTLDSLKAIMTKYPDKEQHCKVYAYLFYRTCPYKELNPFFHIPEDEKEEFILKEVKMNFSIDEPEIEKALEFCCECYETETVRAFNGFKSAIDKLSIFLGKIEYSTGRDGNITSVLSAMKNFADIRESFKRVNEDLEKEQNGIVRGKQNLAYDSDDRS